MVVIVTVIGYGGLKYGKNLLMKTLTLNTKKTLQIKEDCSEKKKKELWLSMYMVIYGLYFYMSFYLVENGLTFF